MKQKTVTIFLREKMTSEDGWGHMEGRRVHEELLREVERHPGESVFRISLKGVYRTDASFPRESVCELARRFRGEKGFCLVDVQDVDLLENWDAAARRREQPLIAWLEDGSNRLIGVPASEGTRPLFDMVVRSEGVTAGEIASQLPQSLPNVSNKLKALWNDGYIMRRERVAATGGIEFEYFIAR